MSGWGALADLLISVGLDGVVGVFGESLTGFSSLMLEGLH